MNDTRGRAGRWPSGRLALAAVGAVLVALVNPFTLVPWWLRSPFLSPGYEPRVWLFDVVVLVATWLPLAIPRRARAEPARGAAVWSRANLLLVFASLFVAALLLEGMLRLVPGEAFPPSLRNELYWRARHTTASPEVVTYNVYSPTLGWEIRPDFRGPGISTNSQGLRGTREYALEPPARTRRVLCVGDSFTFGEHLAEDQTMPARLDVELNGGHPAAWEVLNLGVPGYGTDQQWLGLAQKGLRYAPDVVALFFFEENLYRNTLSFRDYAKPYFVLERGRLALRNVPVPSPRDLLEHPPDVPLVYLASFARNIYVNFRLAFSVGDLARTRTGEVTLAILDVMRAEVTRRGATLVLADIPRPILPRPSDTERMLEDWARRTGTPFVNLRLAYLELPPAERATLYLGHWTPSGAAVTARSVAERVRALPSKAGR